MRIKELLEPQGHYKELVMFPDTYSNIPYYDIRNLPPEIPILKPKSHCQVLIDFLGELCWINIAKRNLVTC